MCGVGDDCADLAEAGDGDTFASHGDEFIVDADAVVSSHFVSARAKKSRKCEVGKSDHCGRVCGRHAEDGRVGWRGVCVRCCGEEHLKTIESRADLEIFCGFRLRAY